MFKQSEPCATAYELFLLLCERNRRKKKKQQKVMQKLTDEELELLIEKEQKDVES